MGNWPSADVGMKRDVECWIFDVGFWILDLIQNSKFKIDHSKFVGCGAVDGAAVSDFTISRMLPESF